MHIFRCICIDLDLSKGLVGRKLRYTHVEKIALASVHDIKRIDHYILSRRTVILSVINPMIFILSCQMIGEKYTRWIVILQEFGLEFEKTKAKKSLVFVELMSELPFDHEDHSLVESIKDEYLFLINSNDPSYGEIIIYLQTQCFHSHLS